VGVGGIEAIGIEQMKVSHQPSSLSDVVEEVIARMSVDSDQRLEQRIGATLVSPRTPGNSVSSRRYVAVVFLS
jgi:hypothetical protein